MQHGKTSISGSQRIGHWLWQRTGVIVLAGCLVGMGGCAQMQTMSRKLGNVFGNRPTKVKVSPPPAPAHTTKAPEVDHSPVVPLKTIISKQLLVGHYAEGRRELHHFLQRHPDDRVARDLWRQLTVNPDTLLGSRSRIHVVKPGDSYSSLAARYLGDAARFLVLARYNNASNPSALYVGQKLRIPVAVPAAAKEAEAGGMTQAPSTDEGSSTAKAAPASSGSKAEQLQQQSIALDAQGHHQQALVRLGQALDLDPGLKSSGDKADQLRKQLLASYHQRAIVLYRDQKLSQAISLWDKVLAIDPSYEPAIIYRARARELQSRLKQL